MNNIELIKNTLGIENLEDYISEQYLLGKRDAILLVDEAIDKVIEKIKNEVDNDLIVKNILSDLIYLKKIYFNACYSDYFVIVNEANEKAKKEKKDISLEINEVKNISNFIIKYYDFKQLEYINYYSKIKKVRENSKDYNIAIYFISKTNFLFEKLNDLNKLDGIEWNWLNFEKGLIEVLKKNFIDKQSFEINKREELNLLNINYEFDLKKCQREIENLNSEIISLNNKNELLIDYYNKYYFNNQILIQETYFGDNLPFLFNFYNFLKKNNLLYYGWSYFYSCMVIGSKEMVPLVSFKKNIFVGYLFFRLKDFLIMQYQDNYFEFYQNKFLINGDLILNSFKPNYIKKDFNNELNPELKKIKDFFEKQSQIYNKI